MKRTVLIILLSIAIPVSLIAANLEINLGLVHEFEGSGFESGYKYGAAYGIDFGAKYSFVYADITATYRQSEVRPFKARISLNAAFDIWKLRMALGVGNDLSLIRTGDEFQIAWGGIPRESIIDTPLFLRFETSFNQSPLKVGFVLNLATPWIISKNNFPDVFKAYGDKDLFLYYMKSSSIALIVQWSPTF